MTTAMIATFIFGGITFATALGGLWLIDEANRKEDKH